MQVEGQSIDIRVSFDIELIPVLEKALVENPEWKEKGVGLIEWVIQNKKKEPVKVSLISEISEWTSPVLDTINLAPYEQKVVVQSPFSIKLLKIYSIIPANLILRAKIENEIIYEETKNINIRAADEMIWSASKPYDLAFFIASWVTPKDPIIEQILSIAKEKLPDRSLHGYQQGNPEDVMRQVAAIFYAVRNKKK